MLGIPQGLGEREACWVYTTLGMYHPTMSGIHHPVHSWVYHCPSCYWRHDRACPRCCRHGALGSREEEPVGGRPLLSSWSPRV